jgi:Ser/Thr protein kinase RdoA (MazF antagonist)
VSRSAGEHDLSEASDTEVAERLRPVTTRALEEYGLSPVSTLTLLNVSENATFAVDDPDTGVRTILRVHRHGYHDGAEIASELDWLEALREDTGVATPHVIPSRSGDRVLALPEQGRRDPRHVVHFEFLPGTEPQEDGLDLPASFEMLGAITARMHGHVERWQRPPGFRRFAWDYDGAFGEVARWGRWQDGMAVGQAEREVLGRLATALDTRLGRFGSGPDRYGLIHADLRLANLLEHDGNVAVIDFDDCGWGWYLYDFGTAVSFFEHDPRVPELADAWTRGYRSMRELSAEDEAEIPTFVMMRRLLLVAWIGSHSGTDLAQDMGEDFTATSCELAEDYLGRFG